MRNRITYLSFLEFFEPIQIFSTGDIQKAFPSFDSRRLVEWQAKNYLQKLSNKWYCFTKMERSEFTLFRAANSLCKPSYISLETALEYYGMIPEATFSMTSITTKKTNSYSNERGIFTYRSIKNTLFFGYKILKNNTLPVLIAEPEKAVLDYLYLHPEIQTAQDMEAIRLNQESLDSLDWEKLAQYLELFNSRALEKRVRVFIQTYHYAQL